MTVMDINARYINPWKAKIKLGYVQRFSQYRAVNTLRLGYKNQSVNAV